MGCTHEHRWPEKGAAGCNVHSGQGKCHVGAGNLEFEGAGHGRHGKLLL